MLGHLNNNVTFPILSVLAIPKFLKLLYEISDDGTFEQFFGLISLAKYKMYLDLFLIPKSKFTLVLAFFGFFNLIVFKFGIISLGKIVFCFNDVSNKVIFFEIL